jgi:hypothetical protein
MLSQLPAAVSPITQMALSPFRVWIELVEINAPLMHKRPAAVRKHIGMTTPGVGIYIYGGVALGVRR